MLGLNHFLVLAAILFCIGLFGVLTSKNALRVVICVELILNAVNINLAAFSAYVAPKDKVGMNFVVFLVVLAAAEIGLGLALLITLNRSKDISSIDSISEMKW